jgi:hypothetical protein
MWVAEEHFPESKKTYLNSFRTIHADIFGGVKKKKKKV